MSTISIGADHGAFELKEFLKMKLEESGYTVLDWGVYNGAKADYPDIAKTTCEPVLSGEATCGIVLCGTGIGISIAANKIKGIRAALLADAYSARMAKEHNDANVIALGGRTMGTELAWDLVRTYLNSNFSGGRHCGRIEKIMDLEEKG